jgi:hypothetical protein
MATRVWFHFLSSTATWFTSSMGMLSSIESVIQLTKNCASWHAPVLPPRRIIATAISSTPSPWTSSFHSTCHWIRVFIEDSTFCFAFWIVLCGLDERYWALEDMLRVPKGQASIWRPPGYQRVSRWWQYCGWTRVWNGQERQYCQRFQLFESSRSHQLDRLPSWDHGHTVVQEGPGGLNLLFP